MNAGTCERGDEDWVGTEAGTENLGNKHTTHT